MNTGWRPDPDHGFIFHAASAEGEGGIFLLEIYGAGAAGALEKHFRPLRGRMPGEGEVRLGQFTDASGTPIDEVLLSRLSAPALWCGLPGWCLSCHGGAISFRRICSELDRAGGRREDREGVAARARAVGALDRIRSDAWCLLPACRTARAARYLVRMIRGELSLRLREASRPGAGGPDPLRRMLEAALEAAPAARRLIEPHRVLIAGRPNAGKSSLFNRLAGKERAAVTAMAGTTRDLLEETVEIAGFPVVFMDSAGLRPGGSAEDPVEEEGMRRAREADADSVLFLIERRGPPEPDEEAFLSRWPAGSVLIARTKADLAPPGEGGSGGRWREAAPVSTKSGEGLEALRERIRAEWLGPPESVELPAAPFSPRQAEILSRAARAASVDGMRKALLECFE